MSDLDAARRRFWSKVDPNGEDIFGMGQRCWRWVGAFDDKGRPRFKVHGRSMNANRALFLIDGRELKPDECVIAICHQRGCVNPAHHVLGTLKEAENVADPQLSPFNQSILRGAFVARKLSIEQTAEAFSVSLLIAKTILREEVNIVRHPLIA